MISHHSTFTFFCDNGGCSAKPLVINAKTERTAISKVRRDGWDVLRVRAVSGVPRDKVATTPRRCYCPGCSASVGVFHR